MTTERIDVLAVLESDAAFAYARRRQEDSGVNVDEACAAWDRSDDARAAVAELIERDKAANKVFDSILRAVNDTSGDLGYRSLQYVPAWFKSWAKTMLAAGFTPSTPEAGDIKRALASMEPKS